MLSTKLKQIWETSTSYEQECSKLLAERILADLLHYPILKKVNAVMQYAPAVGSTIGTRKKVKEMGYKLNQYGLFKDEKLISQDANKICQLIQTTISRWVVDSLIENEFDLGE